MESKEKENEIFASHINIGSLFTGETTIQDFLLK